MNGSQSPSVNQCKCKVIQKAEQYELCELNEKLIERYCEGDASLRDLETYVNVQILDSALNNESVALLSSAEQIYEILTNSENDSGKRTELRKRLQHAGVEIDLVEKDFVSYQTIRTHLRKHLDVETSSVSEFDTTAARARIGRLESRLDAVVAESLERLQTDDQLHTGNVEIISTIHITCNHCNHTYYLDDFLSNGGCECDDQLRPNTIFE